MTYPKVTNSIDGVKRMTMVVKHRIALPDLEIALGELLYYDYNLNLYEYSIWDKEEELLKTITKAEIWKSMKRLLEDKGQNFGYAPEGWDFEKQYSDFAAKHIRRWFPEFPEEKEAK